MHYEVILMVTYIGGRDALPYIRRDFLRVRTGAEELDAQPDKPS